MPNHCSNSITVTGPDAEHFFAEAAKATGGDFIGHLIPMPAVIKEITTGGRMIDGTRHRLWREVDGLPVALTEIELAHIKDLHGTADWYEWAKANWGTKWGAYDVQKLTDERIVFDSAWSPPHVAIATISEMFPDATFTLAYAEGGSCFFGLGVYEHGMLTAHKESGDFWGSLEAEDEDADILESCTPECRNHINEYDLHTGG